LHTNGRTIVDANGCTLPLMKGFNMQIGPWSQTALNTISGKGAKIERLVVFWDALQSTNCSALSSAGQTYASQIDQQLAWAQSAGIYTELDLHLNVGRIPACASGVGTEFDDYMANGKWITQYLANRYGNASSPEYTKDVIAFGLNEPPPPSNATATNLNTVMENDQSTMLTWVRGAGGTGGNAPHWMGFVAYAYAGATPLFNANPGQTNQCSDCANGNPTAYNAVGGNVILDVHDYIDGCISGWTTQTGDPASMCDGRVDNGLPASEPGGPMIGTGDSNYPTFPPSGESQATAQNQMANFLYPYKVFTQEANIPLMIGEFGWNATVNSTGATNLIQDYMTSWATASPAIEMEWDYNVTQAGDGWAADPGSSGTGAGTDGWLSMTDAFLTKA
jgi:hypothetical protein